MIYARIENDTVKEIVTIPDGITLQDCFHPSFLDASTFIDITDIEETPDHHWKYKAVTNEKERHFTPPTISPIVSNNPTLQDLKVQLLELAKKIEVLENQSS